MTDEQEPRSGGTGSTSLRAGFRRSIRPRVVEIADEDLAWAGPRRYFDDSLPAIGSRLNEEDGRESPCAVSLHNAVRCSALSLFGLRCELATGERLSGAEVPSRLRF